MREDEGFIQATTQNLPTIDVIMLIDYLSSNEKYKSPEIQGVKACRSMRENYGDVAVGWVQLKRVESICTVKAKICPEQRTRQKDYSVEVLVNEKEETVLSAQCLSCTASEGGCKHALALLAWINRRFESPASTSVECYWKKPLLSSVGVSIKYKEISEIVPKKKEVAEIKKLKYDQDFLLSVLNHPKAKECNSHIVNFFSIKPAQKLSLHHMSVLYNGNKNDVNNFIKFCSELMTCENCLQASKETIGQSKSPLWFELRYGRITASKLYEAAHCLTVDGSLVGNILGNKSIETTAMCRGIKIEEDVILTVCNIMTQRYGAQGTVKKSGLILNKNYPMLGASPDGITDNAVIEVKSPSKKKTVSQYYTGNKIAAKYKAQLHMQMFFAKKNIGFFCVAAPDFEKSSAVTIIREEFDKDFIMPIIKNAISFWEKNIFTKLMKNILKN